MREAVPLITALQQGNVTIPSRYFETGPGRTAGMAASSRRKLTVRLASAIWNQRSARSSGSAAMEVRAANCPDSQRHPLGAQQRCAVVRPAAPLRSDGHGVEPVLPLAPVG